MTNCSLFVSMLVSAMCWNSVTLTPLRNRLEPDDDVTVTDWDYQADVYNNRVLDDVPDERVASKSMRPTPSDNLPILTIPFSPSDHRHRLPTAKDMNERVLLKLIGSPINEQFLSINRPADSVLYPNGTMDINFKKGLPKDELPDEIQHLRFNLPSSERTSEIRIKSQKHRRLLRQYLWAHSFCPVVYKWKDLGPRFWPRWINEGDCYREKSCSIPAGMTCKASESMHFTVLYWHCRARTRCKWIAFKYPLISKCTCGC